MSSFPSLLAQFDGQVLPGGTGKIVAIDDTTSLTALPITDLTGVPFSGNLLTASPVGVLPGFRTADYRTAVSWVSGSYRMDIPALDVIPAGGTPGQILARAGGNSLQWIDPPIGGGSGDGGSGGGGGGGGNIGLPPVIDLAPAEDIPVVTTSSVSIWTGVPTIEGSAGWYREKRIGVAETSPGQAQTSNGELDLNGSSYYRYPGLPSAVNYEPNSGRLVVSTTKPGGAAQAANWLFNVEFITTSPVVEFALNPPTANGVFGMVLVDGKRVSNKALRHTGAAGTGQAVKLTFPTSRRRVITVLGLNQGVGRFGGVAVAPGHTVAKPVPATRRTVAIIGDSYVNGAGDVGQTETFAWRLAWLLGATEVVQAGIGGTGWVVTPGGDTTTRFISRVAPVMAMNPDVVIFAGGRNDSATGVKDAVQAALAGVAGKQAYVLPTAQNNAAVNTAMREGAEAVGVPYLAVDVDGKPKLADGVHMTFDGHVAYADEAYSKIYPLNPAIPTPLTLAQQIATPGNPLRQAIVDLINETV